MNYTKKSWTCEEEQEMLDSIRRKETFEKIARRHERTPNAIRLRFGMVCMKKLESNQTTMRDLCQEFQTDSSHITQCMDALENIQKKNTSANTLLPSLTIDPAELTLIKEEVLSLHEKTDKIYRHVKKIVELLKTKQTKITK